MRDATQTDADLDALVARVREALDVGPPLRLAVIFGSRAAGGPVHAASDLDLAIVPEDPALALSAELSLQAALSRAVGCEVDLVRLDRAPPLLRWEIARKGRVVLPGAEAAFRRFQAQAALEHADMAPLRAAAGRRFRRALAGASSTGRSS